MQRWKKLVLCCWLCVAQGDGCVAPRWLCRAARGAADPA
ncbi:hypothetical protein A2U01_0085404, partial [Trifolium medium]|nr:hypothetical protein [Trifolium medium]